MIQLMRARSLLLGGFLLAATPLLSDGLSNSRGGSVSIPCLREIVRLHGVWRTDEVYLPIYADLKTFAYLASLGTRVGSDRAGLAILPVYAREPIHFRHGQYIFLSTGLILGASDEEVLLRAIQDEIHSHPPRRTRESGDWASSCAEPVLRDTGGLEEMQTRLSSQIAQYEAIRAPRLKRR
jgi:hypothetical protein